MIADQARAIWIATGGDDASDGSQQRPFATLGRAMQWLARRRRGGDGQDFTLHVGGGVYRLDRPVSIGRDVTHHTGSTIIRGAPDRSTVLCGSVPAQVRPLSRYLPSGDVRDPTRGSLLAIELPAYGCNTLELGTLGFSLPLPPAPPLAIRGGRVLTWARWPRQGSLAGQVVHPNGRPDVARQFSRSDGLTVSLDPHDIAVLAQEADLSIEMVVEKPWRWFLARVLGIDTRRGHVATSLPASLGSPGQRVTQVVFRNAVTGLSSPYVAVLDPSRRRILVRDEPDERNDGIEVTVNEAALIHLIDARNVEIRDFVFRFGSGSGLVAERCERIAVRNCDLRDFARDAIALDGTGLSIEECEISDTGAMGVRLRSGDMDTLRQGDAVVRCCRIRRWARRKQVYEPGIGADGVGIRMVGCTLSDAPHLAIGLTGNDHEVRGCTIRQVVQEFDDMGAIYVNQGETPLRRGLLIEGNAFCDIGTIAKSITPAVYLDRASYGVQVIGNLFLRIGGPAAIGSAAVMANGTSDVLIRANLFVDCTRPVLVDFYLTNWGVIDLPVMEAAWDCARLSLSNPMLPHHQRYPELTKFATEDRLRPRSNAIFDNVCFDPDDRVPKRDAWSVQHADAALVAMQGNSVVEDSSQLSVIPPIAMMIVGRTESAARNAVERAVRDWFATVRLLGLVE